MAIDIPQNVADYFAQGSKKILNIEPKTEYKLILYYSDGSVRLYDLADSLYGVFKKLEDPELFSKVFIDDSGAIAWDIDSKADSSIQWNNRIDICPDAAYMDSIEIHTPQEAP